MKKIGYVLSALLFAATAAGCSSAYYSSAGYAADDLYAIHDKTAIAQRQQAEALAAKAEAEARRAQWEARIAEAEAAAAEKRYYASGEAADSYSSVLADTYESAYARRLRGFSSPTYRMPSSYYNFRYGSTFNYVSAYDPAFYNVMVMGDEVWVEPKYVTSMFGTWGRPAVYVDPWYYGWNYSPYHYSSWGLSTSSWGWHFGWSYSWYDPWYRPGYRPGYYPCCGPGWGPGRPGPGGPHYAGYRRPPTYYNRPGGRNQGYTSGRPTSSNRYGTGSYSTGSRSSYTGGSTGSYQQGSRSSSTPFSGSSTSRSSGYTSSSKSSGSSSSAGSRGSNSGYSSGRSSSGNSYGTGSRSSGSSSGSYSSGSSRSSGSSSGSYSSGSSRSSGSSGGSYSSGGSRGGSSSSGGRGYGGR